jgi:hypothetical protein
VGINHIKIVDNVIVGPIRKYWKAVRVVTKGRRRVEPRTILSKGKLAQSTWGVKYYQALINAINNLLVYRP